MTRRTIVVSMLAVFLAGTSLGLMGGILFSHHMHEREFGRMGGPGPGRFPGRHPGPGGPMEPGGPGGPGGPDHEPLGDAMPRLTYMLQLTPEQVARIQPKVIESRQQFAAARESLHARISTELTPEQRTRWEQLRRHMPFPGNNRGAWRRNNRANPGNEGEPR